MCTVDYKLSSICNLFLPHSASLNGQAGSRFLKIKWEFLRDFKVYGALLLLLLLLYH
jgi:hypothetical protein